MGSDVFKAKLALAEAQRKLDQALDDEKNCKIKPDIIDIAEMLHHMLCRSNHTDGCDWHYYKWIDTNKGYAKSRYIKIATEIRETLTVEEIRVIFEAVNK